MKARPAAASPADPPARRKNEFLIFALPEWNDRPVLLSKGEDQHNLPSPTVAAPLPRVPPLFVPPSRPRSSAIGRGTRGGATMASGGLRHYDKPMKNDGQIPAALAIDGLASDARQAFEVAAKNGYRGIAFATHHAELNADALGESGRRHLRTMLTGKGLGIEAVRAAVPRGGLTDAGTIDRTLENVRKAMSLARALGVKTVGVHIGMLGGSTADGKHVGEETMVAALRDLAQQADAAGVILAVEAEGGASAGEAGRGAVGDGGMLARMLKAVDFEGVRGLIDGARAIGSGEDPVQVAELLVAMGKGKGAIGQVTLADAVRAGRAGGLRPVMLGEGQLAVGALMSFLREEGFDGATVVDVRDLGDGAAGAQRAAEVLRRLM